MRAQPTIIAVEKKAKCAVITSENNSQISDHRPPSGGKVSERGKGARHRVENMGSETTPPKGLPKWLGMGAFWPNHKR